MVSPLIPFCCISDSAPAPSAPSPAGYPGAWKAGSHQILVVDDDETVLTVASIILTRAGMSVSTARDGEAGWDATVRQTFDLIVTDNDMPKLRGVDLIRRLRSTDYRAPIVLISGGLLPDDRLLLPLLGHGAILPKPFDGKALVEVVQRLLVAPSACLEARERVG